MCQFTIHFPLYSENTHQAPLKRQVPENLKTIRQTFSIETNFSALCCEQKFCLCVRMVAAPSGVGVGSHFQSARSNGSPEAPLGGRVGCRFPAVTWEFYSATCKEGKCSDGNN